MLRKKKDSVHLLGIKAEHARKRKSNRNEIYRKAIRYFRVWAHRRIKTLEKEVEKVVETEVVVEKEIEKIVEVEIEVEKTVEVTKEVPVEIKVEVPVEVERIVEVSTEVPVYIEKIKKVPEPVFIKDPQVIIHERVVPVPENITAEELEKLLNAQPRLNADARDAEEAVVVGAQGEGTKEQSRSETNDKEPNSSAA
ncbi:hypothetical protein JCM19235_1986 [Vibrio maritimus]|uniref:Uncharacterized protein n=1 Tax=Vibrio maritimus TaxID=990268 RepID=A0A090RVI7_9VIBR|nr:hypothetical protein JCM19235_1986 [Vibrio maritimus]